MSKPVVSVVIPCYNHGDFLEETIQSVEESTKNYEVEIIVVNDGSTDEQTIEVFQKLERQGYTILNQENQGLGRTRNNGIRLAKGKYILPLDSDNTVTFHYLNSAIDILEKDGSIDIVYGDAQFCGEKTGVWKNKELDAIQMLYINHIDACAVYRKSTWEKVNGYATDMPYMGTEDWNFWLKCMDKGCKFNYLEEICFNYRVLLNSMIRTTPDDYKPKTLAYNTEHLYDLYIRTYKAHNEKINNIFHGNIFKKLTKMILNHFNRYHY